MWSHPKTFGALFSTLVQLPADSAHYSPFGQILAHSGSSAQFGTFQHISTIISTVRPI